MIILAHDGSLYGDWVARYALNLATAEADRKLLLLHVLDGKINRELVVSKFASLQTACSELEIEFIPQLLELENDVYRSLRHAIPHTPENLLLCGTRVKTQKRSLLRGSITEQLLRCHQCPVLALRVVQPGLLGSPHDLLLPLAGHASGFDRVCPVFRRFANNLQRIHLFRSLHIHHLRHAHLKPERERRLLRSGQSYLEQFSSVLRDTIPEHSFCIEQQAMIAPDWPNAVLTQASRLKVQIVLLGASERNLAHRFFHGVGIERVLKESPCDVGIYRSP